MCVNRNFWLVVGLVWLLPLTAAADEVQQQLNVCTADATAPGVRVAACGWLIDQKKGVPPDRQLAVYFNLARGHDGLGEYDRATRIYAFLLEHIPPEAREHALVRARRGDSYRLQGDWARAIADYDWLLERHPNELQVRGNRAISYAQNGQPARAIADYDEVMRQLREAGREIGDNVYLLRADAYGRNGELDKAIADCDRALAIRASSPGYNQRAWTYYRAGRHAQAVSDVEQALALDPLNAHAAGTLAHLLVVRGQAGQAKLMFERAMLLGGTAKIKQYQTALSGHGYKVDPTGRYDPPTNKALIACLEAGCGLVE